MTELWLLFAFFTFVLAGVSIAGYFLLNRADAAVEQSGRALVIPDVSAGDGFGAVVRLFQMVGQMIPGAKAADNPLRRTLVQAGYRLTSAVYTFYGIKCASALTFGMLAMWGAVMYDSDFLLGGLAASAFGFMLPDKLLLRFAKARSERLRKALPAALDLMVLAVEAGQPVEQAMIAASRGLKATHPDLAAELTQLHLEARASNNRLEALRNFASRNRDPELKKFSALLIDTDRFGTSVGPALRDHAKYLRIRFRQQAQETARKVGVKLIFPVFFLIFPSVVLVTLGPAVILIFTQLKSLM